MPEFVYPALAADLFQGLVGIGLISSLVTSGYRQKTYQKIKKEKEKEAFRKEARKVAEKRREPGETGGPPDITPERELFLRRQAQQTEAELNGKLARCEQQLRSKSLLLDEAWSKLREHRRK